MDTEEDSHPIEDSTEDPHRTHEPRRSVSPLARMANDDFAYIDVNDGTDAAKINIIPPSPSQSPSDVFLDTPNLAQTILDAINTPSDVHLGTQKLGAPNLTQSRTKHISTLVRGKIQWKKKLHKVDEEYIEGVIHPPFPELRQSENLVIEALAEQDALSSLSDESDLISKNADIFRYKMIKTFHLIEYLNERGARLQLPQYTTKDIQDDDDKTHHILQHDPSQLVKITHRETKGRLTKLQCTAYESYRTAPKAKKMPPLSIWATWVVNGDRFQGFILFMIIFNTIVLGIQAEISDRRDEYLSWLRLMLAIFDYCALYTFLVEIILKWTSNFWQFWYNSWNIFDFAVTFSSLIPEIVNFASGSGMGHLVQTKAGVDASTVKIWASNLRALRIFRALKMVTRYSKIKIILLALTKAFTAMLSITILLLVFGYIYAIVGVVYFRDGYIAKASQLSFPNSFTSVPNAMFTVFQLFTFDHWRYIYEDAMAAGPTYLAIIYILSWVIFGAFVISNVFTGIMVDNFQSIRKELKDEIEEEKLLVHNEETFQKFVNHLEDLRLRKLGKTIDKLEDNIGSHELNETISKGRFMSMEELHLAYSSKILETQQEGQDWMNAVEGILLNIENDETPTVWPKDTLMSYFLAMETLMENIQERKELLNLAMDVLLQIQDDP